MNYRIKKIEKIEDLCFHINYKMSDQDELPNTTLDQMKQVRKSILSAQKKQETAIKFYGLLNNSVIEYLKNNGYRMKEGNGTTTIYTGIIKEQDSIRIPHQVKCL